MLKISFLGGGNMASALMAGVYRRYSTAHQKLTLHVVDPHLEKGERYVRDYGATYSPVLTAEVFAADIVVLAVKPQQLKALAESIVPFLQASSLKQALAQPIIVSIATGVNTGKLAQWLGGYQRIVRAMPNTPAQIGAGVSGLFATAAIAAEERQMVTQLFEAVGSVVWVNEERLIDSITAISGSGPAYVFYMVEALTAAAIAQGFDAMTAQKIAQETFLGASELLAQSGEAPSALRSKVTSKKGTTEQGISSLMQDDLFAIVQRATERAYARAVELRDEF